MKNMQVSSSLVYLASQVTSLHTALQRWSPVGHNNNINAVLTLTLQQVVQLLSRNTINWMLKK